MCPSQCGRPKLVLGQPNFSMKIFSIILLWQLTKYQDQNFASPDINNVFLKFSLETYDPIKFRIYHKSTFIKSEMAKKEKERGVQSLKMSKTKRVV